MGKFIKREEVIHFVKSNWKAITVVFLWLLIWAGYNTGIEGVVAPGFPHSNLELLHGLRAFFPIIALFSLLFYFFYRKSKLSLKTICTPMGFLAVYTVIGLCASLISRNIVGALYWGLMYGSVVVVLLYVLSWKDPEKLSLIIKINAIIFACLAVAFSIYFLIQPGSLSSFTLNFFVCFRRPYEGLGNIGAAANFFGMSGTRPTGLARYAGAIAILTFGWFLLGAKSRKALYFLLFIVFLVILLFSKGKTELIGFLLAALFIFTVNRQKNLLITLLLFLVLVISTCVVFLNIPCVYSVSDVYPTIHKILTQNTLLKTNTISKPDIVIPQPSTVSQSHSATSTEKPVSAPIPTVDNKPIPQISPAPKTKFRGDVLVLSGRINTWEEAYGVFLKRPIFGYGFQADRYYLVNGIHVHNTLLQALLEAGLSGTFFFVLAFLITILKLYKLFKNSQITEKERKNLIILSGLFIFFMVRGITESFAYFSADMLFIVPIIAYIQCLSDTTKNAGEGTEKKSFFTVLGNRINIITKKETVEKISHWIKFERLKSHQIIVTGMHGIVEAEKSKYFKDIISEADLFVPDGISVVWLGRLKGFDIKERVSGADLMEEFLRFSEKEHFKNYFYGDTEDTLKALCKKFPNVTANFYSPPFRDLTAEEEKDVVERINQAAPDVLWVGLGLPKQELWIHKHKAALQVPVIIGVGAAFKFLSGTVQRAPKFIGNMGLEWLWRLLVEPKRVWRRVFIDGPLFLWLVFVDFIKNG